MFNRKHLVLTALCTAVIVWILSSLYFSTIGSFGPYDEIAKAQKLIERNYVNGVTDEQRTKMKDAAISAMVYSLKDPYSRYLNQEALDTYVEEKQENYVGVGVSVNMNLETEELFIVSVFEDSPAEKAGILPGDKIKKVGNLTVTAETYDAVLDLIKNGENDEIHMLISRDGETRELTVVRQAVVQQTITYKMLGNKIGYIYISEFILQSVEDFEKALEKLKSMGMQGLVIDLRSNPGGYADSVIQMTDMLLPKGTIAYLENVHGKRKYFYSDERALPIPMVVLINKATASASELMAGSLKAHDLAEIVGEKSFGKAVGQSVYLVTPSTALYLTDSRYYTPNGDCIDGQGITPDVEISLPEELLSKIFQMEPWEDAQLAKALEIISAQLPQ